MDRGIIMTDARLVDYLLGRLPDADAERFDEASIVDDGFAARLRAVEDDLVDTFVRGGLHGETLRRFELYYLASAHRREKVAFARRFVHAVERAAVAAPPRPAPMIAGRTAWRLSMVAAVLVAACATLMLQTLRLGRGMTAVELQREALDRRANELQQQVTNLRAAKPTVVHERDTPAPAPAPAAPIALVLLPETRAAGPVPALHVPPRATRIAFELRLDAGDSSMYQVALRDPAVNRLVWRSVPVAAVDGSLTVSVPAAILKPQHYSLDVFNPRATNEADVIGSYTFEIASR
jgi:hypothetical protein